MDKWRLAVMLHLGLLRGLDVGGCGHVAGVSSASHDTAVQGNNRLAAAFRRFETGPYMIGAQNLARQLDKMSGQVTKCHLDRANLSAPVVLVA
jgi:hypothetical protein